MYSSNSTDRYEIPTSDIERSRRYGAGIYPDYSRGYPVRNNMNYVAVSSVQRNTAQSQQGKGISYGSTLANIRTIEGTELPSSSTGTASAVPYRLNLRGFFSNLNAQDPFQALILEPSAYSAQEAVYNAIACKDLPLAVREKELDWKSTQVRNLLGMIFQDVLPEDRARLKKSIAMLKKAQYNSDRCSEVEGDISFLLHKYGTVALRRHIETYTECCRKVWHYYHPGHTTHPKDDEIFTSGAENCYRVLAGLMEKLTRPNDTWERITANGIHFKNACLPVASTIQYDEKIKLPPESLTETFDSVYLTETNDLTNRNDQNDYEIEDADCLEDTLTIWERIANMLCCL